MLIVDVMSARVAFGSATGHTPYARPEEQPDDAHKDDQDQRIDSHNRPPIPSTGSLEHAPSLLKL
jgi:hypothetical protein